jgi:hypothetical protein
LFIQIIGSFKVCDAGVAKINVKKAEGRRKAERGRCAIAYIWSIPAVWE